MIYTYLFLILYWHVLTKVTMYFLSEILTGKKFKWLIQYPFFVGQFKWKIVISISHEGYWCILSISSDFICLYHSNLKYIYKFYTNVINAYNPILMYIWFRSITKVLSNLQIFYPILAFPEPMNDKSHSWKNRCGTIHHQFNVKRKILYNFFS